MSVSGFPLAQGNAQPKTINPKGDNGQLQPLDSIAEQQRCDVSKIGGAR